MTMHPLDIANKTGLVTYIQLTLAKLPTYS